MKSKTILSNYFQNLKIEREREKNRYNGMNALRVEVLTHKTSLLPSDFSLSIFLFAKYNY